MNNDGKAPFERQESEEGPHATLVVKQRDNGNISICMRPWQHLGFATVAVNMTRHEGEEPKWEGSFHCHELQEEIYFVVVGIIAAIWWSRDGSRVETKFYYKGESFHFPPGVWHDIMTTPGTEFVTLKVPIVPGIDSEKDRVVLSAAETPRGVAEQKIRIFNFARSLGLPR